MANLGNVSILNINGNQVTIKDPVLTEVVNEIIEAIGANNGDISERINDLHNRSFDALIKISSQNESEIANIVDGMYKLQYVTITGEGNEAIEILNNSAILIQNDSNQYLYKDGKLLSRVKTNNTWGDWIIFEGRVTSVNGKTNAVILNSDDVKSVHNYSKDYLTFEALEDTTFTFSNNALQYSIDDGATWITLTANTASPTITTGNKILWKQTGLASAGYGGIGKFSSTGKFNVSGNIMSLYYGDNFGDKTDLTDKDYAFAGLFKNCSKLVNAENLILPATTLADYCYYGIFNGCTSLITAPELPATTLANHCYDNMFNSCTSLTKTPELLATTLAPYCYESMFQSCSSLTTTPELPATTLTNYCYLNMFNNCSSLTIAPKLLATTLAYGCYSNMFRGCTSLITAPELHATTLSYYCYQNMFNGCTSLIKAPELPATTLVDSCYESMFKDCISLIKAPELPATNLTLSCYQDMFNGCTSLNYIKCLATNIKASYAISTWVDNVSSVGTFVKADSMSSSWTTGVNGIPSGWNVYTESEYKEVKYYELSTVATSGSYNDLTNKPTIPTVPTNVSAFTNDANYASQTYVNTAVSNLVNSAPQTLDTLNELAQALGNDANFSTTVTNSIAATRALADKKLTDYSKEYLTFEALENTTFTFITNALQYSLDDGATWTTLASNTATPTITAGNKILWKQTGLTPNSSYGIGTFLSTGKFNVSGNIMSLHYGDDFDNKTNLIGKNYAFANLFSDCIRLVNAENLILPATTLAQSCYSNMFGNCTSLTTVPNLPATTLSIGCYKFMFKGCTSLTVTPKLPATTLAKNCYDRMFNNCTSLTSAPELPAITLAKSCYESMFSGCSSLTTAPILPATTLANYCYDSMFWGCTSLTKAFEILPATTLANYCYNGMFNGCTSLTTAPELPATSLAAECYNNMFKGCTSLNYIKCLAIDISASNSTHNWVNNILSSIGTFIKNTSSSLPDGNDGIPYGWNVYTESEWKEVKHYEIYNINNKISNLNVTHTFVKKITNSNFSMIWIDDFSKVSVQEMYDNYVNENGGYKRYYLTQDTLTIDNITYYMWEDLSGGGYDYNYNRYIILTTTNNYNELLSQSLSEDLNNDFTSFGGFLNEDNEESYMDENNRIQYILNVEQDNDGIYIYVDNIRLTGLDERTINNYINDPETCGCNPYELTSDTINIDGESYYIWERTDNLENTNIHYLLTTVNDYETLVNTSVESSKYNLACKPNNCIFGFMNEDNELYEAPTKNVIITVE